MAAITSVRRATAGAIAFLCTALAATAVQAQTPPVTATQRSTAEQVATQGVPLAELAADAPDMYVVKRGDTLWDISGMYLKRPWRWPELWGMNLQAIHNPHLIFPGQTLYLDKTGGVARLRTTASGEPETVRVSPRTRSDSLSDTALPTLKPHLIEPFLAEPLVVDAETLKQAPRIVGTFEERVLMSTGDRIYARGDAANPLRTDPGEPRQFRVFRDAIAMKDPLTGDILGYEAQYLGKAVLVRGETFEDSSNGKGGMVSEYVPASLDITGIKEEIRTGDRLLPAPARTFTSYLPHAPQLDVDARVVSIYGSSAMANAAQNNVVAINLGSQDDASPDGKGGLAIERGIEVGHVLSLMTKGNRVRDVNDGVRTEIKLPSERNGMVMVFRTFDRVAYALILNVSVPVRVGDRLVNPD